MINRALTIGGQANKVDRHLDDVALCQRIANGEQHLFGQIIDSYSRLVAGCIAAQGVDRDDVEDLAQQAFINAYMGLANFRGDCKLSSWLYTIAINVARAHKKKLAVRPTPSSVDEAVESGIHPIDEATSAAQVRMLQNRELEAALNGLPQQQRTALVLYYLEELNYEEIAEAMRMNLNTVRTQIRRGKQRLAAMLEGQGD